MIQDNVTGNPPHLGVERHWTHRASAHSRVGPKSGGTHNKLGPHMLLRLLIFLTCSTPTLLLKSFCHLEPKLQRLGFGEEAGNQHNTALP